MNITEHTHAAIISLTQYESANYHRDMDTARARLLETMQHIIAISKLTPAAPDFRPPRDLGRPDRLCRYLRMLDYFSGILLIPTWNGRPHNHIGLAWYECVALCEHHGWIPPVPPVEMRQAAQLQPARSTAVVRR
jgi:hypothetical protein